MTIGYLAAALLCAAFGVLVVYLWLDESSRYKAFLRKVEAHEAEIAAEASAWEKAHPDLAAQGCPAPPTPKSMTYYRWGGC